MYVGAILLLVGIPPVLGSCWTFLPVGMMVVAMIVRTCFEEATLRRELPGYEQYTRQTRYRLLPGVW